MPFYKSLDTGGRCLHGGGSATWELPGTGPGGWMSVEGPLVPCENGIHLASGGDLVRWLGPEIFEAEFDGERTDAEGKTVVRRARLRRKVDAWDERSARLFACACAERALPALQPDHAEACREIIDIARAVADGSAPAAGLDEAARRARRVVRAAEARAPGAAVWITARADARDRAVAPAWDPTWKAVWDGLGDSDQEEATRTAWATTWTVATAGGWDASVDAAWAVLGTVRARGWVAARDAARDGARAVAWDALRVFRSHLESKARDTVDDLRTLTAGSWGHLRAEVRADAFAREREFQTKRLLSLVTAEQ